MNDSENNSSGGQEPSLFSWVAIGAGVLGLLLLFFSARQYAFPVSIAGVIAGITGIRISKRDNLPGAKWAIAGLVLSSLILLVFIIGLIIALVLVSNGGANPYIYNMF